METNTLKKVELLQCGKSSCGYILTGDEQVWVSRADWPDAKTGTCPKCGNESFYQLNPQGQKRKISDPTPRAFDPNEIEPSPRMGLKMKRRLLAAKRRAIGDTEPANTASVERVDGKEGA